MALNNIVINLGAGLTAVPGNPVLWPGGSGTASFGGTFANATFVLEAQAADGTWAAAPGSVNATAAGFVNFNMGRAMIRANASSFSTTSVLTMTVTPYQVAEG